MILSGFWDEIMGNEEKNFRFLGLEEEDRVFGRFREKQKERNK